MMETDSVFMPIVSAVVAGALKIVEIRIALVKAGMRHGGNYYRVQSSNQGNEDRTDIV